MISNLLVQTSKTHIDELQSKIGWHISVNFIDFKKKSRTSP